jgi:hypothetical protein
MLGAFLFVGGTMAVIWAENYNHIEPIPGGYREYTIKAEAKALFAGTMVFGLILLIIGVAWDWEKILLREDRHRAYESPGRSPHRMLRYCSQCGNPLRPGAVFCDKCGAEL